MTFVARPDAESFQIRRVPTAKWPKRENLYVKVGEVSPDKQFRVTSFVEKQTETNEGVVVDTSELEIVYLPTKTLHTLVRRVEQGISTRFAELVVVGDGGLRFFVKEGDVFERGEFPNFQFTLVKVTEEVAVIKVTQSGGIEKEFTIRKKAKC